MPRKRNLHRPVRVGEIIGTPKLALYLQDLVREEGYGNTPSEVARTLVWRGIEDLITKGIIDRRKGTATPEQTE